MTVRKTEVEVFGSVPNAPIMRVSGRKYPGVLIQGDSLHNLLSLVQAIEGCIDAGDKVSAGETLNEVKELLQGYLAVYEKTLSEAGMSLPY